MFRVNNKIWLGTFRDVCLGRAYILENQIDIPRDVLGSKYGGHCVGLDGMDPNDVVYSFGVGEDISFDLELIRRFDVTVYAFDPTPRVATFIKKQKPPAKFKMHHYGLSDRDDFLSFNPPVNDEHISHTLLERTETCDRSVLVPFKRLKTIMRELGHSRIDILKMDIEGSEYGVIEDIITHEIDIRQILVEFHHQLENIGLELTRRALRNLNRAGYKIFNFSQTGREISLMKT